MKTIALLILFTLLFVGAKAQEKTSIELKIDSIVSFNKSLLEQIEVNNKIISSLKVNLILTKFNSNEFSNIEIETKSLVNIFSEPKLSPPVKFTVPQKTKITVLGYELDFYLIDYNGEKGYAHYSSLRYVDKMKGYEDFRIIQEKTRKEDILKNESEKESEREAEYLKKNLEFKKNRETAIIKKYGNKIGNQILNGEIWLGMTTNMAIESIGSPKVNNISNGSWGVHEQWVYESRNLYFENDILTSWQASY